MDEVDDGPGVAVGAAVDLLLVVDPLVASVDVDLEVVVVVVDPVVASVDVDLEVVVVDVEAVIEPISSVLLPRIAARQEETRSKWNTYGRVAV